MLVFIKALRKVFFSVEQKVHQFFLSLV